jgi:hypothetical protein
MTSDIEDESESQADDDDTAETVPNLSEHQELMGEWCAMFLRMRYYDRAKWQATHIEKAELAGNSFNSTFTEPKPGAQFTPDENELRDLRASEAISDGWDVTYAEFERYNEMVRRRIASVADDGREWTIGEIEDDDALDLLPGYIPKNQITIAYGLPERGKSLFLQKLALCKSVGIPFDGVSVGEAGRVLYVTLDPGANLKQVKRRLMLMCNRLGISPPTDNFVIDAKQFYLNDRASVENFLQKHPGKWALVVIDSLYSAVDGEVSVPTVATAAIKGAREIAAVTDATMAIAHHAGRGEKGHLYGSIFIDAGASSILYFNRKEGTYAVTVTVEKGKDSDKLISEPLRYRINDAFLESLDPLPQRGAPVARLAPPTDVHRPDMLALMPAEWISIRDARKLIEHLLTGTAEAKETQWRRAREAWEAAGLIWPHGEGGGPRGGIRRRS